jgi:FkbM family methyltransferase
MSLYQGLRKVKRYVANLGSRSGLSALAWEARSAAMHEVSVKHPSLSHPVTLRTRSSDIDTFAKVIAEGEYDLPPRENVRTIIDAGANIGLATLFFAERFPAARIFALEPESSNFALLLRNVASRPNVTCLKKALWAQSGLIDVYDPGDGNWGFRTGGQGEPVGKLVDTVDCISVADLMKTYELPRIDVLKIDIEGSEKEVFEAADTWIDKVDLIVVELHDRFKRGCSRAFYNATVAFTHELHRGENIFVFRNGAKPSPRN